MAINTWTKKFMLEEKGGGACKRANSAGIYTTPHPLSFYFSGIEVTDK